MFNLIPSMIAPFFNSSFFISTITLWKIELKCTIWRTSLWYDPSFFHPLIISFEQSVWQRHSIWISVSCVLRSASIYLRIVNFKLWQILQKFINYSIHIWNIQSTSNICSQVEICLIVILMFCFNNFFRMIHTFLLVFSCGICDN